MSTLSFLALPPFIFKSLLLLGSDSKPFDTKAETLKLDIDLLSLYFLPSASGLLSLTKFRRSMEELIKVEVGSPISFFLGLELFDFV